MEEGVLMKLLPDYFNISEEMQIEIEMLCIQLVFRDRLDENVAIVRLKEISRNFTEEQKIYAFYILSRNMVLSQTVDYCMVYQCSRTANWLKTIATLPDSALRETLIHDRAKAREFLKKEHEQLAQKEQDYIR